MIASKFLQIIGFDVICNEIILSIEGAQPVRIHSGCNFFKNLHNFLFFFVSFPSNKKRMFKYIFICLLLLSIFQIFRISSFAICLKYLPQYWIILHSYSSYLFFYPCALIMWYHFSSKTNVINQKY